MTKPIVTAHPAAGYERTIYSFLNALGASSRVFAEAILTTNPERYQVDSSAKTMQVLAPESASIAALA